MNKEDHGLDEIQEERWTESVSEIGKAELNARALQDEGYVGDVMQQNRKNVHKWAIWVIFGLVAVVLIGVTAWVAVGNDRKEDNTINNDDTANKVQEIGGDELVEVSIDDPEVERLIGIFRVGVLSDAPFVSWDEVGNKLGGFYSEGSPVFSIGMPDTWKIAIAIQNVLADSYRDNQALMCEIVEELNTLHGALLMGEQSRCVPGDKVQAYLDEIFRASMSLGKMEFEEDEQYYPGLKIVQVGGSTYAYSVANNGFFEVGARGGGGGYAVVPYWAAKDGDKVYVFTVVSYLPMMGCMGDECKIRNIEGDIVEEIDEPFELGKEDEIMLKYKDELDRLSGLS